MLTALAIAALLLILVGAYRLHRAYRAERQRRRSAAYRAALLVVDEHRKMRAGQHRAQEREWGRAA